MKSNIYILFIYITRGYGVEDTFNNMSIIPSQSVLLVEKTGVPEEKKVTDKLYHTMLYRIYITKLIV